MNSSVIDVYFNQSGNFIQRIFLNESEADRYIVSQLEEGTIYYIQVAGINTRGIGNYSSLVPVITYTGMLIKFN